MKLSLYLLLLFIAVSGCSRKSTAIASEADNSNNTSDTIGITQKRNEVFNYLKSISGRFTIAGIHNREPNAKPERWTDSMYAITGKYPGFWSGDFLFQKDNINNRQIMVNEALKQWQKGAVVQIMWHACNPALKEPCGYNSTGVLSKLSDAQWKDLITEGTPLNKKWKAMIDEVCVYLKFLQKHGVAVLWRPLHEMNQGAFWWGGRPGPNGTRRLYQLMHNYMTKKKGLTNLIWVWDMQDFSNFSKEIDAYNPGDQYWDVAALDVYDDHTGYSMKKYNTMVKVAHGKPIGIGECQKLPTPEQLKEQSKWTFFMSWSELTVSHNTRSEIKTLYNASNIITRDQMPGWK